ncbi:MAG: xanthine dehydrogenase family protein subunit M [Halobacteriaceae archaeon]
MFPPQFDYYSPDNIDDALSLLDETSDSYLLAGGHALIPDMKDDRIEPGSVIDIRGVDRLQGIEERDQTITIGALTTFSTMADSSLLERKAPVIQEGAEHVGDLQIRNMGTLGGNIAAAKIGSDLPATLLAADATIYLQSQSSSRRVKADSFFVGKEQTTCEKNEIITHISVPHEPDRRGIYRKETNPATGYALVGVAITLSIDEERIRQPRIAVNGAVDHSIRLESVESGLDHTSPTQENIQKAVDKATNDVSEEILVDDMHASGEYRKELMVSMTENMLTNLCP